MTIRDLAKLGKSITDGKFNTNAFPTSVSTALPTSYATTSDLPDSGLSSGGTAFVTENNGYYISDDSNWYRLDFDDTNSSPSITSITFGDNWNIDSDSVYYFDSDTTKTYTITINAIDSDNLPIKYSLDSNTTFNQYATITFNKNVATIELIDSSAETVSSDLVISVRDAFAVDSSSLSSIRYTRSLYVAAAAATLDWSTSTFNAALAASDNAQNHYFGYSVDVNGDYAVIGAYGISSFTGAAYVFTQSGGSWTQQAKLTASDAATGDYFGNDVSIFGNTIAVGAPFENDNGAVYIYTRSGSTWTQQSKITAPTRRTKGRFGQAVDLDGSLLIVGEPMNLNAVHRAYIFQGSGSSWTNRNTLTYSGISSTGADEYGRDVAIDSNSNTAVVGAWRYNTSGGAFVYTRTGYSGTSWSYRATLTGDTTNHGDKFGYGISVKGNSSSSTIAVSAYETDVATLYNDRDGVVYIYTGSGATWTEKQKIIPPAQSAIGRFGQGIDMDRDNNNILIVGEPRGGSDGARGHSHFYLRDSDNGSYTHQKTFINPDNSEDRYGAENSVTINGSYAMVGAPWKDSTGTQEGRVYVYEAGS